MKGRVVMLMDRLPMVTTALGDLVNRGTYVGIPEENNARNDTSLNNATIGYIHEHGAPEANIPARPWLVPGASTVRDQVAEELKAAGKSALGGNRSAIEGGLNRIGLIGVSAVRNYLLTAPFLPLSPVTIRERMRRRKYKPAQGIDRPLVDTGQMLRSVTYVVRDRKRAGR